MLFSDDEGLSGGAIGGIVAGVVVLIIVIIIIVFCLQRKSNKEKDLEATKPP